MINFYKYMIYRMYSRRLRKASGTPVTDVILILTFVHYIELFIIYLILLKIFPIIAITSRLDMQSFGIGYVIFVFLNYKMLYKENRWKETLEEYRNEPIKSAKRRKWLILIYLIAPYFIFKLLLDYMF